jgi:hypothetical protein
MKKAIVWAALSVALLTPLAATAQDHRFYDRHHKDYHEWNDHEDRAWHMYWQQRHHGQVDWARANERDRQRYWDWRHSHSDAILNINIR